MGVVAAQLQAVVSVQGADKAKSDLEEVGESVNKTGGFLKDSLGNALGFASNVAGQALGFLKDQFVDSVKIAMDHQQVMAQTAQAIRSTKDASGETASSIDNLADSLSHVTEFSHDTIQSGENLLLTFTGIGKDVFPETTQAMLDLSQATGQDMKSSAIQLGKALNDPLTGMNALARVGVSFSSQEKEQIKTMMAHKDVMGAQKVMLKELETEFGGSATAAGKTFAGQVQILKNNFEDLKEKIGTAILPILSSLMSAVSTQVLPLLEKFSDWFTTTALPPIQRFASFLADHIGPAFKALTSNSQIAVPILAGLGAIVASVLVPAFAAWAIEVIAATWPFIAIGVAVAGLVAIFMHFYNTNAGFRDFINGIGKALQQFGAWIMNSVGAAIKFLTPYFQQAGAAIAQFGNDIQQRAGPAIKNLQAAMQSAMSFISAIWNAVWPSLADVLHGVWDQIVGVVKIAWALLSGIIKIGLDILGGNWGQAWEDFKTMLAGVWDGIKQYVKGGIEALVGMFRPLLVAIANIPGPIGDMAKKVLGSFDSMNQGVKQSTGDMKTQAALHVAKMHEQIVSKLEVTRQEVIRKIQETSDPVQKKFLEMKEKSIEHMEQMHEQAASKALATRNAVVNHMQNMQDQVVGHSIIPDMVNSVVAWFAQLPGRVLGGLQSFASFVLGIFNNLAGSMVSSGADMINNFINGLDSASGGLIAKAQSIASSVASILHFSKPDTGPLRDADQWMPDMMSLLASGIEQNMSKVKNASLNVAATIANPNNQSSFAGPSTGGLGGLSVVPSSVSQGATPINITVQSAPVYLDGKALSQGILGPLVNQIRSGTGTFNY